MEQRLRAEFKSIKSLGGPAAEASRQAELESILKKADEYTLVFLANADIPWVSFKARELARKRNVLAQVINARDVLLWNNKQYANTDAGKAHLANDVAKAGFLDIEIHHRDPVEAQFELNQRDLGLDDLKAQWGGMTVALYVEDSAKVVALLDVSERVPMARKIKQFCVKAHYRCSAVVGDKVNI